MEKISWNDSYSVGVEEIDKQHKEFFRLMHRLQIMQEKNTPREFTLRILHELGKYADYHFVSEENLMLMVKYPDLERHRSEHQILLRGAAERIEQFESGCETLDSFLKFLRHWLISHIQGEDIKVGRYLGGFARDHGQLSDTVSEPTYQI